jgi:hypothetical protein
MVIKLMGHYIPGNNFSAPWMAQCYNKCGGQKNYVCPHTFILKSHSHTNIKICAEGALLFYTVLIVLNHILSIFYYFQVFHNSFLFIFFIINIPTNLGGMSHNVPAVCDVFLCPIKKLRSSFRAQKNVGGVWRGNGA